MLDGKACVFLLFLTQPSHVSSHPFFLKIRGNNPFLSNKQAMGTFSFCGVTVGHSNPSILHAPYYDTLLLLLVPYYTLDVLVLIDHDLGCGGEWRDGLRRVTKCQSGSLFLSCNYVCVRLLCQFSGSRPYSKQGASLVVFKSLQPSKLYIRLKHQQPASLVGGF